MRGPWFRFLEINQTSDFKAQAKLKEGMKTLAAAENDMNNKTNVST